MGCLLLAGAARALAVRDRWIGWDAKARREQRVRVLNNSRFLIFPHVQVPHLASHVLGQLARRVRADWLQHWGFEPLLLETFVDPRHYAGTCYRAAGWQLLGETSGSGLARPGQTYHPKKSSTSLSRADPSSRSGTRQGEIPAMPAPVSTGAGAIPGH